MASTLKKENMNLKRELLNKDDVGLAWQFRVSPDSCDNPEYYENYLKNLVQSAMQTKDRPSLTFFLIRKTSAQLDMLLYAQPHQFQTTKMEQSLYIQLLKLQNQLLMLIMKEKTQAVTWLALPSFLQIVCGGTQVYGLYLYVLIQKLLVFIESNILIP